jgi:hypothetical protein
VQQTRPAQAKDTSNEISTDLEFSKPTRSRRAAKTKDFEFEDVSKAAPLESSDPFKRPLSSVFNEAPDSSPLEQSEPSNRKSLFEEESKVPRTSIKNRSTLFDEEDEDDIFSKKARPRNRKSLFLDD